MLRKCNVTIQCVNHQPPSKTIPEYTIVKWKWGYLGLVCHNDIVARLAIADKSKSQCTGLIKQDFPTAQHNPNLLMPLQQELIDYSHHRNQTLNCKVNISWATQFGQKVLRQCIKIKHGKTASYKQLAINASSPNAARAVGSIMAKNRIAIIIPCHRIISTNGQLGGYSAANGPAFKQKLLCHEKAITP